MNHTPYVACYANTQTQFLGNLSPVVMGQNRARKKRYSSAQFLLTQNAWKSLGATLFVVLDMVAGRFVAIDHRMRSDGQEILRVARVSMMSH